MNIDFSTIWSKITHSESKIYPSFSIPTQNIIDETNCKVELEEFSAGNSYLQVRIREQFIKDKREYWNEYNPLSIVLTEMIYDGKHSMFPFIVGPGLLRSIEELEGNEGVHYRNTRIVGPVPYQGDDVALFIGLYRIKTKDWAKQAISLLESVAGSFDTNRLSEYLKIAQPILHGIEDFFGMGEQMQYRLGVRTAFTDPSIHSAETLKPGHVVLLRSDESHVDCNKFWLKEGRLFFGNSATSVKPYTENDYILYQIQSTDVRNDFTTFGFHRRWEKVQELIWAAENQKAIEEFQIMVAEVRQSPDIVNKHKNQLQLFYHGKLQEEIDAYKLASNPMGDLSSLVDKGFKKAKKPLFIKNKEDNLLKVIEDERNFSQEVASKRVHKNGPELLTERSINEALNSNFLNQPEIFELDPDSLGIVLNLDFPME